jgi:hypothetical protein
VISSSSSLASSASYINSCASQIANKCSNIVDCLESSHHRRRLIKNAHNQFQVLLLKRLEMKSWCRVKGIEFVVVVVGMQIGRKQVEIDSLQ